MVSIACVYDAWADYFGSVTHFSMWALVKSPLILSNDITSMVCSHAHPCLHISLTEGIQSDETKAILTNEAIIALNQDGANSPATRVWKKPIDGGDLQLWSGWLAKRWLHSYVAAFTL